MNTQKYAFCLALAAIATLATPAYCGRGYVLLVDQTPIEGGIVTPGVGVHNFAIGEKVEVRAVPKPGYQFVRWMGDVGAVDASRTSVTLDSPKMLVAVFEKAEYAMPFSAAEPGQLDTSSDNGAPGGDRSGGGGGRMTAQNNVVGGGGGINPAVDFGSNSGNSYFANPVASGAANEADNSGFNGQFPVNAPSVPEPATMALMGIGAAIGLLRRRI